MEKTQQSFIVQEVVWGLRKESIEHETILKQAGRDIRFMTPIRSCIPENNDNRPRDLYRCGSLGMFSLYNVYIKTHKTAINRPVNYTGET